MDIETLYIDEKSIIDTQPNTIACIGYFDGLHIGHQQLLLKARTQAKQLGYQSAMITFDPDPLLIVKDMDFKAHIMTLEDKINKAYELGIEKVIVLKSSKEMMSLSPDVFIEKILVPLNIKQIVCGFDFRFGHKGAGSGETLLNSPYIDKVYIVEAQLLKGEKVSSTRIINGLKEGDIEDVTACLGHPYYVKGQVKHGSAKGREIGFPTANLDVEKEYVIPKIGVYHTQSVINNKLYDSLTNIGYNTTFNTQEEISIETYILDFNEDIYHQSLTVFFKEYIRDEIAFESIDALVDQMKKDEAYVRTQC